MKGPFIRSIFNYDTEAASNDAAVGDGGPSLTVQSMAEDADINVLMKRYGILQQLPGPGARVPEYGDFSDVSDFQSALQKVMDAEENFMLFPAELRAKCRNSPQVFMDYCADPANLDELRKFGLAKPAPVAEVVPVVVPPKP